ncbi:MAG: DEAD/DEAH box helicase, partial [Acidobacteria bacterium]|nr:DEAD/DEAH box helicase [Acidobacteriota bacterium]
PPARPSRPSAILRPMFTGAIPQHPVETTDQTFEDMDLSDPILDSLDDIGFQHPTPIQVKAIPLALEGHDVIGLAETGSGKTAAFCIPMAERLYHGRGIRGLILCPTREIALQTKAFLDVFGEGHQLRSACVIGGVKMGPQIQRLRSKPDIVVATPGRLFDHMNRGNVRLDQIEELVLDEADHMLDLGFLPQISRILETVPEDRHTMMFSATMPPAIERLAQRFMKDPLRIDILPKGAAEGISHRLYLVKPEDQVSALLSLLRQESGSTLVFIRRKIDAEWAVRRLEQEGFKVERIHSNLSQAQRVAALQGLREGDHRILVATDIAARGIDIPALAHIINYGPPENSEDYIHRAGRTARGANEGLVSTIATFLDKPRIREIERSLGEELPRCELPDIEAYVERKSTIRGRKRVHRRLL